MKVILVAVFVMLWAVPIWALEESSVQYTIDGSLKINKASFDAMLHEYPEAKLRVMLTDDPCLVTMEKAMQAMEPYILVLKSLNKTENYTRVAVNGFDDVLKQWIAATIQCWRHP